MGGGISSPSLLTGVAVAVECRVAEMPVVFVMIPVLRALVRAEEVGILRHDPYLVFQNVPGRLQAFRVRRDFWIVTELVRAGHDFLDRLARESRRQHAVHHHVPHGHLALVWLVAGLEVYDRGERPQILVRVVVPVGREPLVVVIVARCILETAPRVLPGLLGRPERSLPSRFLPAPAGPARLLRIRPKGTATHLQLRPASLRPRPGPGRRPAARDIATAASIASMPMRFFLSSYTYVLWI